MMRTFLQARENQFSQARIDEFDEDEHEGHRDYSTSLANLISPPSRRETKWILARKINKDHKFET